MSQLVYQRIISLREIRGLSQADLAELAGIEPSYVSKLERGKAPNAAGIILAKLARALETSTDYLLGLTDNPAVAPTANHPSMRDPRFQSLMSAWQSLAALDDPEPCNVIHDLAIYLATKHAAKED